MIKCLVFFYFIMKKQREKCFSKGRNAAESWGFIKKMKKDEKNVKKGLTKKDIPDRIIKHSTRGQTKYQKRYRKQGILSKSSQNVLKKVLDKI